MRVLEFVIDHVTFKLWYNQIYQMKTTNIYMYELLGTLTGNLDTKTIVQLSILFEFVLVALYSNLNPVPV